MSGHKGRAAEGNYWPEAVFRWHVPNMTLAGFTVSPLRRDNLSYWASFVSGWPIAPGHSFTDTQISSVAYKTPWKNHREGMILPVFTCIYACI